MRKIDDLNVTTPSKGLAISRSLFGKENKDNDVKQSQIIHLSQPGRIIYTRDAKKKSLPISVHVNLKKVKNYTSDTMMNRLRSTKDWTITIGSNTKLLTNLTFIADDNIKGNKVVLGSSSLHNYYVSPTHKSKVETKIFNSDILMEDEVVALKLLDDKITLINKQLNLSKILKPTNYIDEFDKFVALQGKYSPQFTYDFPTYKTLRVLKDELQQLDLKYRQKDYFASPFASLFFEKIEELEQRIALIRAYKKQDLTQIDHYNKLLFGQLDPELVSLSYQKIQLPKAKIRKSPLLKQHDIVARFRDYIRTNDLPHTKIKISNSGLSGITVGLGKNAVIKMASTMQMREYKVIEKIAHEIEVHVKRYLAGKKT